MTHIPVIFSPPFTCFFLDVISLPVSITECRDVALSIVLGIPFSMVFHSGNSQMDGWERIDSTTDSDMIWACQSTALDHYEQHPRSNNIQVF